MLFSSNRDTINIRLALFLFKRNIHLFIDNDVDDDNDLFNSDELLFIQIIHSFIYLQWCWWWWLLLLFTMMLMVIIFTMILMVIIYTGDYLQWCWLLLFTMVMIIYNDADGYYLQCWLFTMMMMMIYWSGIGLLFIQSIHLFIYNDISDLFKFKWIFIYPFVGSMKGYISLIYPFVYPTERYIKGYLNLINPFKGL